MRNCVRRYLCALDNAKGLKSCIELRQNNAQEAVHVLISTFGYGDISVSWHLSLVIAELNICYALSARVIHYSSYSLSSFLEFRSTIGIFSPPYEVQTQTPFDGIGSPKPQENCAGATGKGNGLFCLLVPLTQKCCSLFAITNPTRNIYRIF